MSWSRGKSWRPSCLNTWSWLSPPWLSSLERDLGVWISEKILGSHLWQLHRSERSCSTHPPLSRQNGALFSQWPNHAPHIPFKPEGRSIRIVLLSITRSLHNFSVVTEAFVAQYAPRQEFKRSSHHLLSVKMRPGDNSSHTSVSFRASWSKSPIAVRMFLYPHSLAGFRHYFKYRLIDWPRSQNLTLPSMFWQNHLALSVIVVHGWFLRYQSCYRPNMY